MAKKTEATVMRVRFTENFRFRVPEMKGRTVIMYKSGWEGTVRRVCGAAAVRAGKAVEIKDASSRPAS